jgi:hypothetical protein
MHPTGVASAAWVFAAAPSKVPFYLAGGLLAGWAVLLGATGLRYPEFPGSAGRARLVMLTTGLLVAATLTAAVVTAGKEGEAEGGPSGPARSGPGRRAAREQEDACGGDGPKDGHRAPSGGRREHKLKQRHRVSETILQSAERTVPAVCSDERALDHECSDSNVQPPVTPTGQRTPPDVTDGEEERDGDEAMNGAKSACRRRQLRLGHARESTKATLCLTPWRRPAQVPVSPRSGTAPRR